MQRHTITEIVNHSRKTGMILYPMVWQLVGLPISIEVSEVTPNLLMLNRELNNTLDLMLDFLQIRPQ